MLGRLECLSSQKNQIGNLCAFRLSLKEASLESKNECWQAISSLCNLKDDKEDSIDAFFYCFKKTFQTTAKKCQFDVEPKNDEETTLVKSQLSSKYVNELSPIEGVKPAHHGDDPSSPFSTGGTNSDTGDKKTEKKNCRELSDKHADIRLPECEDSSPFHFWDRAFVVGFILGGVAILVRYIRKENQMKHALLPHRAAASELLSEAERHTSVRSSEDVSSEQTVVESREEKSKTETIV